jgi:hypothetical protein
MRQGNLIRWGYLQESDMCDYSLHTVKSRPAKAGEILTTRNFHSGTSGFAASEDESMAVCLRPGTELAFAEDVEREQGALLFWRRILIKHRTAIFRKVNQDDPSVHHDALEFPDGQVVLLTSLCEGQQATVLQLPLNVRAAAPEPAARHLAACDVIASTAVHLSGYLQQGAAR